MDREALEHELARRLLDHLDAGTTDMADDLLELPADLYTGIVFLPIILDHMAGQMRGEPVHDLPAVP